MRRKAGHTEGGDAGHIFLARIHVLIFFSGARYGRKHLVMVVKIENDVVLPMDTFATANNINSNDTS